MKKKLILLMVALSTLCACDSEMMTEEQIETQSLAASKVEKGYFSEMYLPKGYSDLGIVPQDAQAKMSDEEKNFWSEMSKTFYIDYSVLENTVYTRDKKKYMDRLRKHCELLKNNGKTGVLLYVPVRNMEKRKIQRMKTSSETTPVPETYYLEKPAGTFNDDLIIYVRLSYSRDKKNKVCIESGPTVEGHGTVYQLISGTTELTSWSDNFRSYDVICTITNPKIENYKPAIWIGYVTFDFTK